MNEENIIFALDIGTRTVIGVVGTKENNKFKVIASEIEEHKNRAMMDGQVHDINQVVQVVSSVKQRLENKLGFELSKVAIAAAGRVLRTKRVKIFRENDVKREINSEMIESLEMEAIQFAQRELDSELAENERTTYYCVGYSVLNYYINDYVIMSLLGHKGKSIGVEMLATFLPHTVVDSLYTVVDRAGLEVVNLTLEPIAAINAAIPQELRHLNLALVDIGAGTSDIAITRGGSVVAYGMIPMAGDEITETISEKLLVNFNDAEKIKISLASKKEEIKFTDIMGIKKSIKLEGLVREIEPIEDKLAKSISEKIVEYNEKTPNAVFLVGGGSQLIGLPERIAKHLGLPEERVAVKGRDAIPNLKLAGKKLSGPEAVTPLGIMVTAKMYEGNDFLNISINDKTIRLFNSRKLYVSDALVLYGFKPEELIAKRGEDLKFVLNGEEKIIKGEYGKAAEIYVNGEAANLRTMLAPGDNIIVIPAERGKDAAVRVCDIKEYFNHEGIIVKVNGQILPEENNIFNGDNIEVSTNTIVSDCEEDKPNIISNEEINNKYLELKVNGESVTINDNKKEYMFVDIFNYIAFDINKTDGKIKLKLNGKDAAFTDKIENGDEVEIYWEK